MANNNSKPIRKSSPPYPEKRRPANSAIGEHIQNRGGKVS